MNLNNISLPPQLIADLYQHALVNDTEAVEPQMPPVPSLGKGGKGILIIVNKQDVPFLPDSELEFLTKILSACHLSLADVAIVNWHKIPHQDTGYLLEAFSAKEVILFAIETDLFQLPATLPLYSVFKNGSRRFVAAPALDEIEKTKEAKGQLWNSLKQLFGL